MAKKIRRKSTSTFSRSKKKSVKTPKKRSRSSKKTVKKAVKAKAKTAVKKTVKKAQVTFIPEPWSKVTKYKKIKKDNDFGYW